MLMIDNPMEVSPMNTKRILVLALTLILVAGCSGGKYTEEKTLLTTVTKAMDSFNAAIGSAGAPEDVTKALGSLTGAIEKVLPKMKEIDFGPSRMGRRSAQGTEG